MNTPTRFKPGFAVPVLPIIAALFLLVTLLLYKFRPDLALLWPFLAATTLFLSLASIVVAIPQPMTQEEIKEEDKKLAGKPTFEDC